MNSEFTVHNSKICLPKVNKCGQKKKKKKRENVKRGRTKRPAQTPSRSKLVGSIGGYDEASSLMAASVMDLTNGSGGFDDWRQWRHGLTSGNGVSESK